MNGSEVIFILICDGTDLLLKLICDWFQEKKLKCFIFIRITFQAKHSQVRCQALAIAVKCNKCLLKASRAFCLFPFFFSLLSIGANEFSPEICALGKQASQKLITPFSIDYNLLWQSMSLFLVYFCIATNKKHELNNRHCYAIPFGLSKTCFKVVLLIFN